jgi:hypothetical protein
VAGESASTKLASSVECVGGFWFRKSAKRVIGANSIALDVRNPKDCLVITWILLLRPRQRRLKARAESGLVASSHDTQYPPLDGGKGTLLGRQRGIEKVSRETSWSARCSHAAAVALNYFANNFIKIHRTLCVTLQWPLA